MSSSPSGSSISRRSGELFNSEDVDAASFETSVTVYYSTSCNVTEDLNLQIKLWVTQKYFKGFILVKVAQLP